MKISPVTEQNRAAILQLAVAPDQEGFIESIQECLAEADADARWKPVALYVQDILVGFAMYGYFPYRGGRLWLDRFLIDRQHQGKGYGFSAMQLLLDRITQEYPDKPVYLSIVEHNQRAQRMYIQIGFRFTGELDLKGEKIMVLNGESGVIIGK